MTTYIGIDIGKRVCVTCAVDKDGNVLDRSKYDNTVEQANEYIRRMIATYGRCEAVCESTANMWLKTYETCESNRVPVKLANPLRLKLSQSGVKTDKIDAEKLANRLRMNDIPESYVYDRKTRGDIAVLRQRIKLVQMRAIILNREHNILEKYDYDVQGASKTAKYQKFLQCLDLHGDDQYLMGQNVRVVMSLTDEIKKLDKYIAEKQVKSKSALLIATMPGLDVFGSMLLDTAIDDIERFSKPSQLVSFLGLCPRVYQSGNKTVYGRMKKDVSGELTLIMIQAAMVASRKDPALQDIYAKHCKKHAPLVALSHVANKMATYIWFMLKKQEPYRPAKPIPICSMNT